MTDYDALYTEVHPTYVATQRKDLWFYERLWAVLLRQLEARTTGRSLVEFGCGPGFLCAQAERRGWDALGVEPSPMARQHAVEMLGIATCTRAAGVDADAAIATEVLEHVEDPTTTLREWGDALSPGGFLALSVPNDNNPLQRLFWGRKKHPPWAHPTHIHYFNRKGLRSVVETAGFEVVWERTSFPVELLLVVPFLPRKWAWKLSRLWPAPPLLWRFGVGRHLLMVARKK